MGKAYTTTGIALLDASGGTVVDGVGVASTSQFNFVNSIQGVPQQTINGTAWTDIVDGTTTFVLTRTSVVHIPFAAGIYTVEPGTHTCDGEIRMDVNGTDAGFPIFLSSGNEFLSTHSSYALGTYAAGTNTLKMKARLNSINGTASMTVYAFRHSSIVFGK